MTVDPRLLDALAAVESGGNPRAVSPAGAQGLFQFMPKTSAWLGVDPWDPVSARQGAERYYQYLLDKFGDPDVALAAWNWGEGNVARNIKVHGQFNLATAPRETQDFVPRVKSRMPGAQASGARSASASARPQVPGVPGPRFQVPGTGRQSFSPWPQIQSPEDLGLGGPLVDLILRALWELP
jgi:soluble lytic murein transglycosylase-like protein